MKSKILNFLLIISSLFGYLEWGGGNHMFLFIAEKEIVTKLFIDPKSVIHPFILFPLIGQVLLMISLFQKKPSKKLTYIGMSMLGVLLLFMLFIGLLGSNLKIICSTIPFLLFAFITFFHLRK